MLDPAFKEDWLADLRSGEKAQATGSLKGDTYGITGSPVGTGYCCLGVAVCTLRDKHPEILKDLGYEVREEHDRLLFVDQDGDFEANEGNLPSPVLEQLGLTSADQDALIGFNDDDGRSFSWIADWIEDNL